MPINEIQAARSILGGSLSVEHAGMDLTIGYEQGSLCFINAAGRLQGFPIDGTQALIADMAAGDVGLRSDTVGIACWGPGRAASAEFAGNAVRNNPITGAPFVAGDLVGYYPGKRGNLFKGQVLAAGGAAAGVGLATHKAEMFQVTYCSGTTPDLGWGVELTAAVQGTDVMALVIEVLAVDGRVTTTAGTHFLFELLTQLP